MGQVGCLLTGCGCGDLAFVYSRAGGGICNGL